MQFWINLDTQEPPVNSLKETDSESESITCLSSIKVPEENLTQTSLTFQILQHHQINILKDIPSQAALLLQKYHAQIESLQENLVASTQLSNSYSVTITDLRNKVIELEEKEKALERRLVVEKKERAAEKERRKDLEYEVKRVRREYLEIVGTSNPHRKPNPPKLEHPKKPATENMRNAAHKVVLENRLKRPSSVATLVEYTSRIPIRHSKSLTLCHSNEKIGGRNQGLRENQGVESDTADFFDLNESTLVGISDFEPELAPRNFACQDTQTDSNSSANLSIEEAFKTHMGNLQAYLSTVQDYHFEYTEESEFERHERNKISIQLQNIERENLKIRKAWLEVSKAREDVVELKNIVWGLC